MISTDPTTIDYLAVNMDYLAIFIYNIIDIDDNIMNYLVNDMYNIAVINERSAS